MKETTIRKPRLNVPALAGLWYTASSLIERASAIIFTPIYTRLLLPEEYGVFSIYTSIIGIVAVFATLEISGAAVYRGLREFRDRDRFTASALGLISLSTLISLSVYAILQKEINRITGLSTPITLLLFFQVFLNGVRSLRISRAKFSYDKRLPLIEGIFFSTVIPAVSIALILLFDKDEYARIFAMLFASFIFAIPILFSILYKGRFRLFDKSAWKFILKHTIPSLPHYLSMALIWQIGKITVGRAFSSAETGLLSIAISVGLIPTLLTVGIQSALIPWISRKLYEERRGKEKIYALISKVFLPLSLCVVLFLLLCPELFLILGSKNYSAALPAVYPVCASIPLVFLSNLFSAEIIHYGKTYLITIGSVIGAVFCLFFNLLFTFRLGFAFSAASILISFAIIVITYSIILKRKFAHFELPAKRLFYIYTVFILLVILAMLLKISFAARILLGAATLLLLLPRLRELAPFYKEL